MKFKLIRDAEQPMARATFGQLFAGDEKLGETLEDEDRHLETGGIKIHGQTAIPRGIYPLALTFSNRFGRVMPQILDVPGFSGIRIHGGNTTADTLGCPLLGLERTALGIRDCTPPNARLYALLDTVAEHEKSTIEIA